MLISRHPGLIAACLVVLLLAQDAPGQTTGKSSGSSLAQPLRADLNGEPLPRGAVARFGSLRLRQKNGVDRVAFSNDGKLIASIGWYDNDICLWDVATGKPKRPLHCSSTPRTLIFSPQGDLLVSGHADRSI